MGLGSKAFGTTITFSSVTSTSPSTLTFTDDEGEFEDSSSRDPFTRGSSAYFKTQI